jgi:hypothetical protein
VIAESDTTEKVIDRVVPNGTNGVFGFVEQIVFSPKVAELEGRQAVRFSSRVPLEKSQFLAKHGANESLAPYEGSVWVDAETFDLVRVDLQVKQIPRYVGLRWIERRCTTSP